MDEVDEEREVAWLAMPEKAPVVPRFPWKKPAQPLALVEEAKTPSPRLALSAAKKSPPSPSR